MKYTVLGAGMMGSAVAFDLATSQPEAEVTLADRDFALARKSARVIGQNVTPLELDVNNGMDLRAALQGCDAAVSAISYNVNLPVTLAAIEAGVPLCDLGGNMDVVRAQLKLHDKARLKNVTMIPNCGLAPGLAGILAVTGAREFEQLDAVRMRVGGLPQHPRPPLNYQIVFSAEGLINEYVEDSEVIRSGVRTSVPSMSDLEEITFVPPFGKLEAFNTSGGASMLPEIFDGRVRELDYKTIRYPGHCEKFRMLLDLGFADAEPLTFGNVVKTRRELFADLLRKKLDYNDKDLVLLRVTVSGKQRGRKATLAYELIDYYDDRTGITAMMRTTAFPTSVIAQMLAQGDITDRGVLLPEQCVPGDMLIKRLEARRIHISSVISTSSS
ncbi:saccharopine dehydrogenase [bacterium]|nr:MAG: saccharopine dehydrogenase [bacterium]